MGLGTLDFEDLKSGHLEIGLLKVWTSKMRAFEFRISNTGKFRLCEVKVRNLELGSVDFWDSKLQL